MIIHSIISLDDIFPQAVNSRSDITMKEINGGMVQLRKQDNEYYVDRLFSTNPFMYIDKRYQPFNKYKI